MKCPVRVPFGQANPRPAQPRRLILLGSMLSGALLVAPACAPQVVRSGPPPVPNSPSEMAEDTERLDRLIGAGLLKREELQKDRDQARGLAEQLRSRAGKDDAMAQLALKRAELTVQLYETLLGLVEQKTDGRAQKTEQSAKAYQAMRDYLRKVAELEQNVELLPETLEAISSPALAGSVSVAQLPPPSTERLVGAYRAGHFDQVVKEVEGAGPDALPRLAPAAVTAYALSLGGLGRYDDALKIAARVDGETIASQEELELRFREALWLAKAGKKADATRRLRQLDQEIQDASKRLADFQAPVASTGEQAARRSPKFLESYVDARLAIEDGRFEYARTKSREMLERESAVEPVTAVEGLLRQTDAAEERAFSRRLEEAQALSRAGESEQARGALERIAQDFKAAKFASRIEQAGKTLPLKGGAGAAGSGAVTPTGTPPAGAKPAGVPPVGSAPGGLTGGPPVGSAAGASTGVPPISGAAGASTGVPPISGAPGTSTGGPPASSATGNSTGVPPTGSATGTSTGVPTTGSATRSSTAVSTTGSATGTSTAVPPTGSATGTSMGAPSVVNPAGISTGAPSVGSATGTSTGNPPPAGMSAQGPAGKAAPANGTAASAAGGATPSPTVKADSAGAASPPGSSPVPSGPAPTVPMKGAVTEGAVSSSAASSATPAPPMGAPPPGSASVMASSIRPGAPGSVGAPRIGTTGGAATPAAAAGSGGMATSPGPQSPASTPAAATPGPHGGASVSAASPAPSVAGPVGSTPAGTAAAGPSAPRVAADTGASGASTTAGSSLAPPVAAPVSAPTAAAGPPSGAVQVASPARVATGPTTGPATGAPPSASPNVPPAAAAGANASVATPQAAPRAAAGGSSQAGTATSAPGVVSPGSSSPESIDWQKTLALGKSLMTTGSYEEAARTFGKLGGTPGEKEGREQRQKAMDHHVQRVREQVAKEYMRAQQLKSNEDRLTLLGDLYNRLKVTLESWPDTSLRAKTEHNLRVIEGELQKLDAAYFERHEAFRGDATPAGGTRP